MEVSSRGWRQGGEISGNGAGSAPLRRHVISGFGHELFAEEELVEELCDAVYLGRLQGTGGGVDGHPFAASGQGQKICLGRRSIFFWRTAWTAIFGE